MDSLMGVLHLGADADTEVFEQVPYPEQQNKADGQCYKDLVHGLRGGKVAQEHSHVAAQGAQN